MDMRCSDADYSRADNRTRDCFLSSDTLTARTHAVNTFISKPCCYLGLPGPPHCHHDDSGDFG